MKTGNLAIRGGHTLPRNVGILPSQGHRASIGNRLIRTSLHRVGWWGGHVNLHVGYHSHAVTGCSPEVAAAAAGHAPIIGIAMDGYPLMSRANADGAEPADLDACRGHDRDGLGYHYHANQPGANQTIGCFKAEYGCTLTNSGQSCDATKRPKRP